MNVQLLLKANADPDHMTMVGVTGDMYTYFGDLYMRTVQLGFITWVGCSILLSDLLEYVHR